MNPILSVILPTIRTEKIIHLYESIQSSYSGDWEILIVSPYDLPDNMNGKHNVRYFNDWGSPMRCQQIGLVNAKGDFITRAVDDSVYVTGMLDKAFLKLGDPKTAVILKHTETNASVDRTHKDFQRMEDPDFYNLTYHNQTLKPYVPAHYKIMNFGIVPRALMVEIGGWDCQFETPALGELDLSIRLQFYGVNLVLSDDITVKCDWIPGTDGDHAPMHYGFDADNLVYSRIYSEPECEDRVQIDINNWQQAPSRWERRFGE